MWQKLKPKECNIDTKVILEPNVAIMMETHSENWHCNYRSR